MSRSGYGDGDDFDPLAVGRWRAQVRSATRGKRGQAFLKGILEALDAMPEKRLVRSVLVNDGYGEAYHADNYSSWGEPLIVGADELVDKHGNVCGVGDCCAMGAYAKARGIDTSKTDPEDPEAVAALFDVPHQLAREIAEYNDEMGVTRDETPEQRWVRMRAWVDSKITKPVILAEEGVVPSKT